MAVSDTNLLGKQVSFIFPYSHGQLFKKGAVTSVISNLNSSSEILIDDQGDFYSLSEIIDFQILD